MRRLILTLLLILAVGALVGAMRSVSHLVYFTAGEAAALGRLGAIATVNKFGFNADVDTTEESIWDADDLDSNAAGPGRCFTNMSSLFAAELYISSDDEADAGLSVTVMAINLRWEAVTIVATLGADNGNTGTEFVQIGTDNLFRINRAFATGDAFAGNIYMHKDAVDIAVKDGVPDAVATDTVAVITAGENQTLQACYTVPLGFTAMMDQFCVGNRSQAAAPQDVTFRLRSSVEGAASRTTELLTLADSAQACIRYDEPIVFSEKTDIELTADAAGASQATSGTFDITLVPSAL